MADTPAQKAAQRAQIGVELPDAPETEQFTSEPQRPEGLPEKFNSWEDMAKSYSELETELRTRAETQNEMQGQIDGLTQMMEQFQAQQPAQPQYQPPPQSQDEVRAQLYASYEQDPVGTMVFLANAAAQNQWQQYAQSQQGEQYQQQTVQGELMADNASRLLETRYPDWREYEQTVGAMIEANPNLLPPEYLGSLDATAGALEAVYKQAKYDDLVGQLEDARNGVDSSQMKRNAQTMSGAAGRAPEPSDVDVKMAELLAASRGSSYSAFRGR